MLSNALQHPRVAGVMGTVPLWPLLSERGTEDTAPHFSLISGEGASWALPLLWLPSVTAFQTLLHKQPLLRASGVGDERQLLLTQALSSSTGGAAPGPPLHVPPWWTAMGV